MTRPAAPSATSPNAWPAYLAAVAALATGLWHPDMLADGDTWWHVKTGLWILDHGQVPRVDLYSSSMPGAPWTAHEWLSEILMALGYRAAGWSGVVTVAALAASLAMLLLGRRLARDLAPLPCLVVLAVALGLAGGSLLARPHILALPVLVAWTTGLMRAREEARAPGLRLLPLMTLWANLHGGFAFGLALLAPFALEALLAAPPAARIRVVVDWALFGVAALGAALVTPFGIEGLLFPVKLLGMASLAAIAEWRPASFGSVGPFEVALLALVAFALHRRIRVPPVRLALLVGMIHLALAHSRHQLLLAIVGALVLARPIADAMDEPGARSAPPSRAIRAADRALRLAPAAALAIVLGLLMARLAAPIVRRDGPVAPIAAVAAVTATVRDRPVLNEYGFGGYLIWAGLRPFIDGRADMYGDAFMDAYARIARPDRAALEAALAQGRIAWTIFPPGDGIVPVMDAMPGWRRIHADPHAVVHARDADLSAGRTPPSGRG